MAARSNEGSADTVVGEVNMSTTTVVETPPNVLYVLHDATIPTTHGGKPTQLVS